jgi:hypothetical protein
VHRECPGPDEHVPRDRLARLAGECRAQGAPVAEQRSVSTYPQVVDANMSLVEPSGPVALSSAPGCAPVEFDTVQHEDATGDAVEPRPENAGRNTGGRHIEHGIAQDATHGSVRISPHVVFLARVVRPGRQGGTRIVRRPRQERIRSMVGGPRSRSRAVRSRRLRAVPRRGVVRLPGARNEEEDVRIGVHGRQPSHPSGARSMAPLAARARTSDA